MVCLHCDSPTTSVKNSRLSKKGYQVWRRRHCPQCRTIFTTYEQLSSDHLPLIAETLQHFSLPQLTISIYQDLPRSDTQADIAYELSATVLQKLLNDHVMDLSLSKLIEVTYSTIYNYDSISGMRYGLRHGITPRPNPSKTK